MKKEVFPFRGYLLFFALYFSAVACEPIASEKSVFSDEVNHSAIKLSGEEILQAFTNVRDDAMVQDESSTRAVNYWHGDGSFTSSWRNLRGEGEVSGSWRVRDNLRCTLVISGIPGRVGKESCGAILRSGSDYISLNADGSIHGMHTLSPLAERRMNNN